MAVRKVWESKVSGAEFVCFLAKNRRRFSALRIATMCLLSMVGKVEDFPRPSAAAAAAAAEVTLAASESLADVALAPAPPLDIGAGESPEGIFAY